MPTLRELQAQLYRRTIEDGREVYIPVTDINDADGVDFLCPKCYAENGGSVGTHHVLCWFVGRVPDGVTPGPGRWNPQGTGIDDLTFVPPGAFSVWLNSPGSCGWHGYVKDGSAE